MSYSERSVSDVLMSSWGVWFVVADEACDLIHPRFWQADMTPSARMLAVRAAVTHGEAFDFTTILDGTFLVRFIANPAAALDASSVADVCEMRTLILPTGRVMIRSGNPTHSAVPAITVTPGRYDVKFEWFVEQESKHYDIEDATSYPTGDGPDGIVTLRLAKP